MQRTQQHFAASRIYTDRKPAFQITQQPLGRVRSQLGERVSTGAGNNRLRLMQKHSSLGTGEAVAQQEYRSSSIKPVLRLPPANSATKHSFIRIRSNNNA